MRFHSVVAAVELIISWDDEFPFQLPFDPLTLFDAKLRRDELDGSWNALAKVQTEFKPRRLRVDAVCRKNCWSKEEILPCGLLDRIADTETELRIMAFVER